MLFAKYLMCCPVLFFFFISIKRSPKHSPGRTQSNLSTIVSSGGGTTQTISSPSPITQYAANGEAQKQSASPPHHHSNPHAQSQGMKWPPQFRMHKKCNSCPRLCVCVCGVFFSLHSCTLLCI